MDNAFAIQMLDMLDVLSNKLGVQSPYLWFRVHRPPENPIGDFRVAARNP
jgi:hypothetical protein